MKTARLTPNWTARLIGETAMQLSTFLMMKELGLHGYDRLQVIRTERIGNLELFDLFGPNIQLVDEVDLTLPVWDANKVPYEGNALHSDRAFVSVMADMEKRKRRRILPRTLPRLRDSGSPYVVLHVRSHGFRRDSHNDYRNADIASYRPAVEYLTSKGYNVIRIGDPTMAPLPDPPKGFTDLTQVSYHEAWWDLSFIDYAAFMIATTSGPWILANLFNTPLLQTNVVPPSERPARGQDIYIPKLIRGVRTYRECCSPQWRQKYKGLRPNDVLDNTPEEILAATSEMLLRLEKPDLFNVRTPEQFWIDEEAMAFELRRPRARMAQSFINRHPELLG